MPNYPAASRRLNEQGRLVVRVELDETGRIAAVRIAESSGHKRLDDAGLEAVKNWHCNAATRNGVAVRGIAMQPFDFILD
jgi:protein TonB